MATEDTKKGSKGVFCHGWTRKSRKTFYDSLLSVSVRAFRGSIRHLSRAHRSHEHSVRADPQRVIASEARPSKPRHRNRRLVAGHSPPPASRRCPVSGARPANTKYVARCKSHGLFLAGSFGAVNASRTLAGRPPDFPYWSRGLHRPASRENGHAGWSRSSRRRVRCRYPWHERFLVSMDTDNGGLSRAWQEICTRPSTT